jgi:isocitrate dehydrogenase kinase/phosphatase
LLKGELPDFFPYDDGVRFCNRFPARFAAARDAGAAPDAASNAAPDAAPASTDGGGSDAARAA